MNNDPAIDLPADPLPTLFPNRAAFEELLSGLRRLDQSCGSSAGKHERAIVLIHACIAQGINTRGSIMAVLLQLGFVRGHIAIVLEENSGSNPSGSHWERRADGAYESFG